MKNIFKATSLLMAIMINFSSCEVGNEIETIAQWAMNDKGECSKILQDVPGAFNAATKIVFETGLSEKEMLGRYAHAVDMGQNSGEITAYVDSVTKAPGDTILYVGTCSDYIRLPKVCVRYEYGEYGKYCPYGFFSFENVRSIESLNKLRTDKVTGMQMMFGGCSALKQLDISNFSTDNVTNMQQMFIACSALKQLNLSNFNTENVTDMQLMFAYCPELEYLNLSSFNTSKVTKMASMFYDCEKLNSLVLSDNFTITQIEDNTTMMFDNCGSSLEGMGKIRGITDGAVRNTLQEILNHSENCKMEIGE